jgi:hypothetical protein
MDVSELKYVRRLSKIDVMDRARDEGILIGANVIMSYSKWIKLSYSMLGYVFFPNNR